jgi:hypothetical protein
LDGRINGDAKGAKKKNKSELAADGLQREN